MKTLRDFDVKNKRVLVRADFNVPLDKQGNILDDFRIKQTIPTIEYLIKKGAKVILMSHLGRPDGKIVENLRLTPIQDRLMEYLDISIIKAPDCISPEIKKWIAQMQPGEIILLENVQFNPEEKENDQNFAKTLAGYADIFIFEAFGQAHRNYASIASIPKYLPSGAGFLVEKEIKTLSNLMKNPKKPLVAIVGGAKAETKTKLIDKVSKIADCILVNHLIGQVSKKTIAPVDELGNREDIGEKTIKIFKEKIASAKTILWNGPLGLIEKEEFSKGTAEIARAIVKSGAFSVVGGGETVEFIAKLGLIEKFNHVSTGGGAMLAFLSGEKLPGLEALNGRSMR